MMDEDGFDRLAQFDAIYLGAIGAPTVPDHISAGDLLLPLRKHFNQYINLRPMRLLPGLTSPLANRTAAEIDMVCVRENTEGEYAGVGGRIHVGTDYEIAEQTGVFTRHGIERVVRYGCEVAAKRPRRMLASATKSNALRHSMVLWDEVADGVAAKYPAVNFRKYHVDAIAARMVTHPQTLDVIVASNLFGDILTDLGAARLGQPRHRAGREHQPRARVSVDVRADSRVGAGHRGQGHRQSDWRDLGRRADARPPRAIRTCTTASSPGSSASWPAANCARRTSAARRHTADMMTTRFSGRFRP